MPSPQVGMGGRVVKKLTSRRGDLAQMGHLSVRLEDFLDLNLS